MSSIDKVVSVQISRQTQAITQAGFGIPLILGPNAPFTDELRPYTTLGAVGDDFADSDIEYVLASKAFAQTPRPERVLIGKSNAAVAQVVTFTPGAVTEDAVFTVTINGEEFSYTAASGEDAGDVVAALIALINGSGLRVVASGTSTLIVTSALSGLAFTYLAGENMTAVLTTPNAGIGQDILKAAELSDDWYFLLLGNVSDATVEVAGLTIEAMSKLFFYVNDDPVAMTAVQSDINAKLRDLSLFRTAGFYTKDFIAQRADAALVGRVAPLNPGSETWAFKTLATVTPERYTDGEEANLDARNLNYYKSIGGVPLTVNGKVIGGEYIDTMRFVDWLKARIQERIFRDIATLDKLPYTDGGIAIVESNLRAVLEQGIRVGGLVSYTVSVPKAASVPPNDKAQRILKDVKFTAVLAGAIHKVEIQGVVTI